MELAQFGVPGNVKSHNPQTVHCNECGQKQSPIQRRFLISSLFPFASYNVALLRQQAASLHYLSTSKGRLSPGPVPLQSANCICLQLISCYLTKSQYGDVCLENYTGHKLQTQNNVNDSRANITQATTQQQTTHRRMKPNATAARGYTGPLAHRHNLRTKLYYILSPFPLLSDHEQLNSLPDPYRPKHCDFLS